MNDRIQELITAYLHRGATPAQERELFEACSRQPETAELLRSHLVLSLKLRNLRDETHAPLDARNNVLRRINTLETEGIQRETTRSGQRGNKRRDATFNWLQLTTTAAATAALVAALFLWYPDNDNAARTTLPIAHLPDTVYIVEKDTVTQILEIERPVTIVRTITASSEIDDAAAPAAITPVRDPRSLETDAGAESGFAEAMEPEAMEDAASPLSTDAEQDLITAAESDTTDGQNKAESTRHGQNLPPVTAEMLPLEERTQTYLEQYNTMLVSVESVRISAKDRIH
jgi:hypothetical protein